MTTAAEIIATLNLAPHPEGGWFCETWRGPDIDGRSCGTAIYFLLEAHQKSNWHRVDATEIWHWHAGHPLELRVFDGGESAELMLGPDLNCGHRPQQIVPAHAWQAAQPRGGWALVGCTVSPGFQFTGFELAPENWQPTPDQCAGNRN